MKTHKHRNQQCAEDDPEDADYGVLPWRPLRPLREALFAFGLGVFIAIGAFDAAAQEPPVTFSIEPEESGKLVYLPIVPETATNSPSNLLGLRVRIANNSTNELRLTGIRLTFPVQNGSFGSQFIRDLAIPGGSTVTDYLTPEESIKLPHPAPATVEIDLLFQGYNLPKSATRELLAYESPAPGGKYLFPANAADLGPDEYFSHVDPHTGGSQFFGYDFHVRGWNGQEFSSLKPGTDGSKNEDSLGWDVPIYSMADGVVLSASTGWEDNPVPGMRGIQRMDEATDGAISDVKVTKLSATRAASLSRLSNQTTELTIWDALNDGREITQLGSLGAESADLLALDALTGTRLVSAFRTSTGNLRVVVWDVSTNGTTITRRGERDASDVLEVSLIKLSSSQFATAVRTAAGELRLIVWEVSSDGLTISLLSHAFAGTASSISVTTLSPTRIATSLRNSQGRLMVIIWDVLDGGATLDRLGDATDEFVTKTVATSVSGVQFDTAARTDGGNLRVVRWDVSEDGETVTAAVEADAGQIQDVAVSPNSGSTVITTVITGAGNLKHIVWQPPGEDDPPGLFLRFGETEAGPTDVIAIDALEAPVHFNAVRTATGDLKVITWRVAGGGGNSFVILHGNCRVLYAHFRDGSVNPEIAFAGARVAAGQFLGRMGNSGSSSGPHTHIHSERISSFLSVEEVIEREAAGTLSLIGIRPIPFDCARALRLSALEPGGESNPDNAFSTMSGHGVYFAQFAIKPDWLKEMYVDWSSNCLAPNGEKNCVSAGRFNIGGPYPTVNQALNDPCWGYQLFIRNGSYNEAVVFDRRMVVRSYDGTAVVGE